ncbi:MAG: hypothetical protein WB607_22700 [Candidatus Acidiferrum sp.]
MATIDLQEFVHLRTLVGNVLESGVHVIDNENHLNRSLTFSKCLEGRNHLRRFVIQNSEILLLKPADRRTRFGAHNHIQGDRAGLTLDVHLSLLCSCGNREQQRGKNKKTARSVDEHASPLEGIDNPAADNCVESGVLALLK